MRAKRMILGGNVRKSVKVAKAGSAKSSKAVTAIRKSRVSKDAEMFLRFDASAGLRILIDVSSDGVRIRRLDADGQGNADVLVEKSRRGKNKSDLIVDRPKKKNN